MFAVTYKFEVKPGFEDQFKKNWAEMTEEFMSLHGGLGSCLHKDDQGFYVAYARWPDKETWLSDKDIQNIKALRLMRDSLESKTIVTPLEVIDNMLLS